MSEQKALPVSQIPRPSQPLVSNREDLQIKVKKFEHAKDEKAKEIEQLFTQLKERGEIRVDRGEKINLLRLQIEALTIDVLPHELQSNLMGIVSNVLEIACLRLDEERVREVNELIENVGTKTKQLDTISNNISKCNETLAKMP